MINFGSSSSKSSSESRPKKEMMWTPEQESLSKVISRTLHTGLMSPTPTYPKQMYVERTPYEQMYLDYVSGNVANMTPEMIARSSAYGKLTRGEPSFEIDPATTEQYYQDVIRNPALQDWKEVYEPQIRESFAGPGYYGSRRAEEQARGAEHLVANLAAARANLFYQDRAKSMDLAESAANRMLMANYAGTVANAGALSRQIDQEKVYSDFTRWLAGEPVEGVTPAQYNPFVQTALQWLGFMPYSLGQESQSSSGSGGFGFGIKL